MCIYIFEICCVRKVLLCSYNRHTFSLDFFSPLYLRLLFFSALCFSHLIMCHIWCPCLRDWLEPLLCCLHLTRGRARAGWTFRSVSTLLSRPRCELNETCSIYIKSLIHRDTPRMLWDSVFSFLSCVPDLSCMFAFCVLW